MSARPFIAPACRPWGRLAQSPAQTASRPPAPNDWPPRSAPFWRRRSPPAAQPCAIIVRPMANSAISSTPSGSMAKRAPLATAFVVREPSCGSRNRAARPSIARPVSASGTSAAWRGSLFGRIFCSFGRAVSRLTGNALDQPRLIEEISDVPYLSTRGEAPKLGFSDALLAGLARDGGLYVPEVMPTMAPAAIGALAGLPYAQAAARVVLPFADGALSESELGAMADVAYAGFRHPAKAPLVQIDDNLHVLELFHGPTLAFKDFAMQWLGRLMNHVLRQRGARATIVGATSGDTGAAAIEAFGGQSQTDVFILYPHGRVSDVQRRQMTTVDRPNVHAIAIEGSFDDCQAIVKTLFNDLAFRDELGLTGVNSINWARILAQIVYYFTAAVSLGAPDRKVSFAVPTGNFGDVLAGYYAKRMGLPIERL